MGIIRHLVFEGGGAKGLAYVGAVGELASEGHLKTVENVAGASAGAIMAAFLGLGYNLEEINELLGMDFREFKDALPNLTLSHWGLHSGKSFHAWMEERIKWKLGNGRATFADLYARVLNQADKEGDFRLRNIHLMGSNLTTQQGEVFSYYTTPDMPIVDAIRISMSFPLFFAAKRYAKTDKGAFIIQSGNLVEDNKAGDMYIDGGVAMNYPIKLFDNGYPNPETLGFRVDTPEEINFLRDGNAPKRSAIQHWFEYGNALVNTAMWSQHQSEWDNLRTVYISTGNIGTLEFKLSAEQKAFLLNEGKKATQRYFIRIHGNLSSNRTGDTQVQNALRLQKRDLERLINKTSEVYFKKDQALLQYIYTRKEAETWQALQARVAKYYSWCERFRGVKNLQLHKKPDGEGYVITLIVDEALHTQAMQYLTKQQKESIPKQYNEEADKLILLQYRTELSRPKWMVEPDIRPEKREALQQCVSMGDIKGVMTLIQEGVPLNQKDEKGNGLLHLAAERGFSGIVKLLQSRGLSVNETNHYGDTPLHKAADRTAFANDSEGETVSTLLQLGANANVASKNGKTSLMVAADYGHTHAIEKLLTQGADINAQKLDGLTALMLAVMNEHEEAVGLLLNSGADKTLRDNKGNSALDYVKKKAPINENLLSLLEEQAPGMRLGK